MDSESRPRFLLFFRTVSTPDNSHSSDRRRLSRSERSLLERLRTRLDATQRALQRRDADSSLPPGAAPARPESLELRALKVVYGKLGRSHRRYRERTGERVPAPLQAAARAFRQEPSVFTLVPVAGYLEDLGLLKW